MSTVAESRQSSQSKVVTTRVCRFCEIEQPIEHFRLTKKGSATRRYECRSCHNKERKTQLKAKTRKKVVDHWSRPTKRDRDILIRLARDMFKQFCGNTEQMGEIYKQAYEDCKKARCHATAAKLLIAMADLLVLSEQLNAERLGEYTEAELEAALSARRKSDAA